MFNDKADFWAPRPCLLAPLPEHEAAANLLSAAVDAIAADDIEAARTKVRQADMPVLYDFARRLMGENDPEIHRRRPVVVAAAKTGKATARMPGAAKIFALYSRDGWRCRFCGCRVISSRARSAIRASLPGVVRWRKAEGFHGAFFAMTASVDHVVPHSSGGGNELENLVTACWSCQFGRGSYTLEEMGLLDPRERAPVVDGWDGLCRALKKKVPASKRAVPAAEKPTLALKARAPSLELRCEDKVGAVPGPTGANWLKALDPASAAACRAVVGFLDGCADLGVSWSLNKVLLARMKTENAVIEFMAVEPDGSVQVPWSICGRKDEFRGFAEKLVKGVPGAMVYETPKLWKVTNADRSCLALPQLLEALPALRAALETLHSALEAFALNAEAIGLKRPEEGASTTAACSAPSVTRVALKAPLPPDMLLAGVEKTVAEHLGVANLRHRSAIYKLEPAGGVTLVSSLFETILANYDHCGATTRKSRSNQNWRWQSLQPQIGAENRSPEVVVERAIAAACQRLGRTDWANQVPVASGLLEGRRYGRRAIDLVRQVDERHFQFIELKIASDTPLYAAIEIIGHACLWLIARSDRPDRGSALLDAERIDVLVLAPRAFYERMSEPKLGAALHAGIEELGLRHGVTMSFAFARLDESVRPGAIPDDEDLLHCLDRCTLMNEVPLA